jgi:hypothetical protein
MHFFRKVLNKREMITVPEGKTLIRAGQYSQNIRILNFTSGKTKEACSGQLYEY